MHNFFSTQKKLNKTKHKSSYYSTPELTANKMSVYVCVCVCVCKGSNVIKYPLSLPDFY